MSTPLISIIVPCYNHAEYLPETLDSVLVQTFANWECIIVNDGSTDNTETIAKQYTEKDDRIKYIHQQNGGLSAARNIGIEAAKGEFILPLDADDLIHKEYLAKAIAAFETNKNLAVVYCQATKFGAVNEPWDLPTYSYQYLMMTNCIFCSAVFRRASWLKIGGYDKTLRRGYEDWEFWLRLLNEDSQVYQIPEVLFFYRIRDVSMLRSMDIEDIEQVRASVYNHQPENYIKNNGSYIKILYENHQLRDQIERMYKSNSFKLGNSLLKPLSFIKNLKSKIFG
jgi:glycosyltransferase involved in cell wall biosynthesis